MKKIFYFIASAIVALGAVACQNDINEGITPDQKGEGLSFYANVEMTRIDIADKTEQGYPVVWENDDVLNVSYNDGDEPHYFSFIFDGEKFTCNDEGVSSIVGKPIVVNYFASEYGFDSTLGKKGLYLCSTGATTFEEGMTIDLSVDNAFFRFSSNEAVTLELNKNGFVNNGETDSITLDAGDDIWVAVKADTYTLTAKLNGNDFKTKSEFEVSAGTIYNLGEIVKPGKVTIDFSTTAQRVSQTNTQQVWTNDGITFTNDKANSSTNVANYSNPVRLYAKSTVTIAAPAAITEIVFTCDNASYATALNTVIKNDGTVTTNSTTVTFVPTTESSTYTFTIGDQVRLDDVTVSYGKDNRQAQTLTFPAAKYEVLDNEKFTPPTLSGAVNAVTYTSSREDVAIVDATTGAVTIVTAGTTVITATAAESSTHKEGKASYTLTVKASVLAGTGEGTETDPYDVTRARAKIDEANGDIVEGVYVKGVVTTNTISFDSTYGSLTYYISIDGETTDELQAYSGLNIDKAKFSSAHDIHAGDEVVVYGNLKKYNSTYEFDYNNYIVSRTCNHTDLEQTVTFTSAPESVAVGSTTTVIATAATAITYSSSDETIATVDATTGVVTGVAVGDVTITATAVADNGYASTTATLEMTVVAASDTPAEYNNTLNCGTHSDFQSWSNSYSKHTLAFTDADVVFTSANKQSGTITDCPVTKGQPIEVIMKNDAELKTITFNLKKWGSKTQIVTLHTSTNGGSTYTTTSTTSNNFVLTSSSLPEGCNAVKITFSSSSNQVGLSNVVITYEK